MRKQTKADVFQILKPGLLCSDAPIKPSTSHPVKIKERFTECLVFVSTIQRSITQYCPNGIRAVSILEGPAPTLELSGPQPHTDEYDPLVGQVSQRKRSLELVVHKGDAGSTYGP